MCVPPHNPKGVEGERYDSLVDNEQNPKIFVMGNSDQMYPGVFVCPCCHETQNVFC